MKPIKVVNEFDLIVAMGLIVLDTPDIKWFTWK